MPELPSGSERFHRKNRLTNPAAFKEVFKHANERFLVGGVLLLIKKNSTGYNRLGMAISRVKIKKACDRNRLKRIIREGFRKNMAEVSGYDIVISTHRSMTEKDLKEISNTLEILWQKAVQYNEKNTS